MVICCNDDNVACATPLSGYARVQYEWIRLLGMYGVWKTLQQDGELAVSTL